MADYAHSIQELIDAFGRLPGIGPKSAQRITFHLLKVDKAESQRLVSAISSAVEKVSFCTRCYNLAEGDLCGHLKDGFDQLGYAQVEGLRYEDFLPVSAAGIFASNLNQYGTKSTAAQRPTYTQAMLEEIMGIKIVDADTQYREMEAGSVRETLAALGIAAR